jgi:hypothetical protein
VPAGLEGRARSWPCTGMKAADPRLAYPDRSHQGKLADSHHASAASHGSGLSLVPYTLLPHPVKPTSPTPSMPARQDVAVRVAAALWHGCIAVLRGFELSANPSQRILYVGEGRTPVHATLIQSLAHLVVVPAAAGSYAPSRAVGSRDSHRVAAIHRNSGLGCTTPRSDCGERVFGTSIDREFFVEARRGEHAVDD